MRKFACNYAQGKHGARFFRTHVGQVSTREEFLAVVEQHFPREAVAETGFGRFV